MDSEKFRQKDMAKSADFAKTIKDIKGIIDVASASQTIERNEFMGVSNHILHSATNLLTMQGITLTLDESVEKTNMVFSPACILHYLLLAVGDTSALPLNMQHCSRKATPGTIAVTVLVSAETLLL